MMDRPLTPLHFLDRAGQLFGNKRVIEAVDGDPLVSTWREVRAGAAARSDVLRSFGVRPGDRVAVLAWNTRAHLELYFGVPGAGAVLLMVNVRLAASQVAAVLADAEPSIVVAAHEFTELADEAVAMWGGDVLRLVLSPSAPDGWTAWTSGGDPGDAIQGSPHEEGAVAMCYTSGTTGDPKGVAYSHRALALHTMAICLPDGFGLGESDVILPAVPMFHANAWGLPHAAAMTGADLVLPGPRPTPALLARLLSECGATFAAGVPTVWMGVLEELRRRPRPLSPRLRIHSGGAPTPPALLEAYRTELGVEILTGWGMTEVTPVGLVTHPRGHMSRWEPEALLPVRTSQGTPLPFMETRVLDPQGQRVPADGQTAGELEVRGPWVIAGYYGRDVPDAFRDGWLRTGDVATVDGHGYIRLVDRTKDLIRSGGEWISSVRLENLLMGHPAVAEAAVVAIPDPKWGERPVATVVLRDGRSADTAELGAALAGAVPSWWIPDRFVIVNEIPRTATGKYDKKALRAHYRSE